MWFGLSYGAAILGYLAVYAFAARLLDDDFGYFVIAIATSTVLGQLGLIGGHRGGLREAARLKGDDVEGIRNLRRIVRAVSWVTLPVTGILTAVATFLVMNDSDSRTRWAVAVCMASLVWIGGQQKLWANYLRGFGQIRVASLLDGRSGGALVALCQGALLGSGLLLVPGLGLAGALAAMAFGFVLPVLFAWWKVSNRWRHVPVKGRIIHDVRQVASQHWRFAVNTLGATVSGTADVWIAGIMLASMDVSLFSAAQRLAILLTIPLTSLGVVFSPVISRLAERDDGNLERLLRTGASLAAVLTGLLWLPILVFPGPLLEAIYGDPFRDAAYILVILTVGSISNVLTGMCGMALTMSRHEAVAAKVQIVGAVTRVVAGFIAVWQFGVMGLAASTAAVTMGLTATLWYLARRRMGLATHPTLRPDLRLLRRTPG